MKIYQILLESSLTYTLPDFNREWGEARRYPLLRKAGKQAWLDMAQKGKPVKYSSLQGMIQNTDAGDTDFDFKELDPQKRSRFQKALSSGTIEMPIVFKPLGKPYDLLGGNTRLTGLVNLGIDPEVWVVDQKDLSSPMLSAFKLLNK